MQLHQINTLELNNYRILQMTTTYCSKMNELDGIRNRKLTLRSHNRFHEMNGITLE